MGYCGRHLQANHWRKPLHEIIKFNCDASFKEQNGSIVTVGRDEYGNRIGYWGKIFRASMAEVVEARALSLAIGIAKEMDVNMIIIEADCK